MGRILAPERWGVKRIALVCERALWISSAVQSYSLWVERAFCNHRHTVVCLCVYFHKYVCELGWGSHFALVLCFTPPPREIKRCGKEHILFFRRSNLR